MDYIIAAIFRGINKRVKNDTPYFNTLMLLSFAVFIHLVQLIIIIKPFGFHLFTISKNSYIISFIIVIAILILFFRLIFPKSKICTISVKEKDIKKYFNIMIIYFLISIATLIFLL